MTRLYRPSRRQTPETIVALVDVVFFLLVFALLIGRMDATAPFQITPPNARLGADMPTGGITVTLSKGASALNGEDATRTEISRRLAALITSNPTSRVRIQADQKLKLLDILPLVSQLEALGAENVVLVVTPGS